MVSKIAIWFHFVKGLVLSRNVALATWLVPHSPARCPGSQVSGRSPPLDSVPLTGDTQVGARNAEERTTTELGLY